MEKWETSPEQFIVGDHLDPAWAIAQSNLARSYMKHLDSVAYNVLDYELVLDGWRADDTSQTKDPLSNFGCSARRSNVKSRFHGLRKSCQQIPEGDRYGASHRVA